MLYTLTLLLCQSSDLKQALGAAEQKATAGDYAGAVAVLEAAGAANSKDAPALTALGTYLLRDAEAKAAAGTLSGLDVVDAFVAAADVLKKAAAAPGAAPAAFVNWSEALLNAGDFRNAARAVEDGLKQHKDALALLLQQGRVHTAQAGQAAGARQIEAYQAADAAFLRAMQQHQGDAVSCVRHGEVQVLLSRSGDAEKRLDEARSAWREAMRRDIAAVDLTAMAQWLGNTAAADLLAEANQGSEDATRLWYQGVFELNAEPPRWEAAKEHLERVLALNPAFTNTWYYLASGAMAAGQRLQAGGQEDAARTEYAYAARAWARYLKDFGDIQIQSMVALEDKGAAFVEQVRWLEGIALASDAAEDAAGLARWRTQARPQDPEAWNNLGFFLREAGRPEESLSAYHQALRLAPDDPQILNDTAVMLHYYLKRDDAEATRLYEKARASAEKILKEPGQRTEEQLQLVRIALRDANNNLRRLQAGDRTNN
ncbi:MAG: tetratricopeptide repeat protein [Planctomycetota bacterium]|nr:MAG: tetratricopeptide repeat protein [Planctomycetota bacterium]